jgi:hypothetical protein
MPAFLVEPKTPEDRKPRPFDRTAVRAMHLSSAAHMGHLDRMGVDLRVMIRLLQTPFERMRRLTAQELKDYRVTTSDELTRAEPGRHRQVLALPRSAPAAKPPAEPAGEALRRASG